MIDFISLVYKKIGFSRKIVRSRKQNVLQVDLDAKSPFHEINYRLYCLSPFCTDLPSEDPAFMRILSTKNMEDDDS